MNYSERYFAKNNGVALAMVFIVLVVLFIGGLAISHLMQGLQRQMVYADASIRCQYIAEAAMNLNLEKLLQKPWEQRWFAGTSSSGTNVPYDYGTYDFFIHDTPTLDHHVDLWIQSHFGNTTRAFFWRIKFDRGLMGGLTQGVAINRITLTKPSIPASNSNVDTFTSKVDKIIKERDDKKKVARAISKDVCSTTSADKALAEIDIIAPSDIKKEPFTKSGVLSALPMLVSVGSPDPGAALSDGAPPNIKKDLETWIEKHVPPDVLNTKGKLKKELKKDIDKIKKLMQKGKVRQSEKEMKKLMKKLNKKYEAKFGSKPSNIPPPPPPTTTSTGGSNTGSFPFMRGKGKNEHGIPNRNGN